MPREYPGPRVDLNAVERLVDGSQHEREHIQQDLVVDQGRLREYEGRVDQEFGQSAYLSQLTDLRDQLKAGLSDEAPEGGMPVAELAEKIKALRAANAVEAAPERTVRKVSRAEVPVTVRIRGKAEVEGPVDSQAMQIEHQSAGDAGVITEPVQQAETKPQEPPVASLTSEIVMPEPFRPVNGHAEAVIKRRQGGGEQLRLF
jgi:hypothetical protein